MKVSAEPVIQPVEEIYIKRKIPSPREDLPPLRKKLIEEMKASPLWLKVREAYFDIEDL